jgi:hypothetical protein
MRAVNLLPAVGLTALWNRKLASSGCATGAGRDDRPGRAGAAEGRPAGACGRVREDGAARESDADATPKFCVHVIVPDDPLATPTPMAL